MARKEIDLSTRFLRADSDHAVNEKDKVVFFIRKTAF